jgi:hypothetical protein
MDTTSEDWTAPRVPTEQGTVEPLESKEDYSILIGLPGADTSKLVRIPKWIEWAFVKWFVNGCLGERAWVDLVRSVKAPETRTKSLSVLDR